MSNDYITEKEVMAELGKGRTALWRLRTKYGFPSPVLSHPARYSRAAVKRWIDEGGINRSA